MILLLTAAVWGTTFIAQDLVSDTIGTFTYNGIRMLLGSLLLFGVVFVKNKGKPFATLTSAASRRALLRGGVVCGVLVLSGSALQQAGIIAGTSAGKSGFITSVYVILVPLAGLLFRRRVNPLTWPCVALAAVGMYFLCMADFSAGWSGVARSLRMSGGDLLTLACAAVFSFHILAVAHFAPQTDGVWLSCVQFFVGGVIGCGAMLLFEKPAWSDIQASSGGIWYSVVVSCCLGYTLQIIGQQRTPPVLASLILCLESVFAVLSDVVFLHTPMTGEEVLGCVLMFAALILCVSADHLLPGKSRKEKEKS